MFTREDLKMFQAENLDDKIQRTLAKVAEWYSRWDNQVFVSFSGGKDSTVLADICARWCELTHATLYLVFVDTGLEYPEIRKQVKSFTEYLRGKYDIEVVLDIVRPKMRFYEVIKKYGYPIISKSVSNCIRGARNGSQYRIKRLNGEIVMPDGAKGFWNEEKYKPLLNVDFRISEQCCDVMKKSPSHKYEKETGRKPIIATMACESMLREKDWLQNGCNAFSSKHPKSVPMSFWTEQDVLQYIKQNQIPIASVYGEIVYAEAPEQMRMEDYGVECYGAEELKTTGCNRTGCIFCAFGCHLEKSPNRFEKLKETHPKQYEYCIYGGEYDENGLWQPNEKGLGLGHIFDELNEIYGDDFIKY